MNKKNFFGLILASSLIIIAGSSCSSAVKYSITFVGDHLHYNGNTEFTPNTTAIGNIYADEGYYIPSEISVIGADEYTYNPENGDVSFVITQNVTINATACGCFKFKGNSCVATGEGYTEAKDIELRYSCGRANPLSFALSTSEEYTLPTNVEVKVDGEVGKVNSDYIYDSQEKTFEIVNLNHALIEVNARASLSYSFTFNINHANPIALQQRFFEGERVEFNIEPEEGYVLPESDAITVEGVDEGKYSYTKDASGIATFVIVGGMPKNEVSITGDCAERLFDVTVTGDYKFKVEQDPLKLGEELRNVIVKNDDQEAHPAEVSVFINGETSDVFTYNSTNGGIRIPKGFVTGPVVIETDLDSRQFPIQLISGIASSSDLQAEYQYGTEVNFQITLNEGYTFPIANNGFSVLPDTITYTFNKDTGAFNIPSMPASPITIKIWNASPASYNFTTDLVGCSFETQPLSSYNYGDQINLKLVPDNQLPMPIVEVSGLKSDEYIYNRETGDLSIPHMPNKDVHIKAVSKEMINVSNDYQIVIDKKNRIDNNCANQINEAIEHYLNATLKIVDKKDKRIDKEIVIDNLESMSNEDKYSIKESSRKVVISGNTNLAKMCAVDRLLTDYISEECFEVPVNLSIDDTFIKENANFKEFKVQPVNLPEDAPKGELRDPFIIESKRDDFYNLGYDYYLYGTINNGNNYWQAFKCENQISTDTEDWKPLGECCEQNYRISSARWAPEVYKYENNYYMFTTYHNEALNSRGVTVMKSSSLEPSEDKFKMIAYDNDGKLGYITPGGGRYFIDGSLYVDVNGVPWVTLVDNFRTSPDGHGRMAVAKLSNDLTHITSSITEIFNANDVSWVGGFDGNHHITDGPFVYRTKSGKLLMQWSSYTNENEESEDNYGLGFATSKNGSMLGPWEQHDRLLFEKNMYNQYTGGHGEFFMDHSSNQLYMCFHSPNSQDQSEDNQEHPLLIPVKEAYDTIVWDLYQH